MNPKDGFYFMPLLPRDIAERIKGLDQSKWPKGLAQEYKSVHAEFTKAKGEYRMWIRRDRDSRMRGQAKAIASYILDCLNCDTGRCDPSHQTIADELGISLRTVERTVPKIRDSGWFQVTRRGKTTSNFYSFRVSVQKVHAILDLVDDLRTIRAERREAQRLLSPPQSEPPLLADHSASDPTQMRSHEPTDVAAHEPTEMAGKSMKGIWEGEPVNELSCSGGREDSPYGDTYPFEEESEHQGSRNPYADVTRGEAFLETMTRSQYRPPPCRQKPSSIASAWIAMSTASFGIGC